MLLLHCVVCTQSQMNNYQCFPLTSLSTADDVVAGVIFIMFPIFVLQATICLIALNTQCS